MFLLLLFYLSFMGSSSIALPIHCEYPCEPAPSQPLYGTPPPPIPPVFPPPPPSDPVCPPPPLPSPPSEPVYEAPPPPINPSYESPPAPQLPTGPLYAASPPPPSLLPRNCQPSMEICAYPPPDPNSNPSPNPNTDFYQPLDAASSLPLNCLHILVLMFISFLHF